MAGLAYAAVSGGSLGNLYWSAATQTLEWRDIPEGTITATITPSHSNRYWENPATLTCYDADNNNTAYTADAPLFAANELLGGEKTSVNTWRFLGPGRDTARPFQPNFRDAGAGRWFISNITSTVTLEFKNMRVLPACLSFTKNNASRTIWCSARPNATYVFEDSTVIWRDAQPANYNYASGMYCNNGNVVARGTDFLDLRGFVFADGLAHSATVRNWWSSNAAHPVEDFTFTSVADIPRLTCGMELTGELRVEPGAHSVTSSLASVCLQPWTTTSGKVPTIHVARGAVFRLDAPVVDGFARGLGTKACDSSLVKDGPGELVLTKPMNIGGTFHVKAGTVRLAAGANLGGARVTVAPGARVEFGDGSVMPGELWAAPAALNDVLGKAGLWLDAQADYEDFGRQSDCQRMAFPNRGALGGRFSNGSEEWPDLCAFGGFEIHLVREGITAPDNAKKPAYRIDSENRSLFHAGWVNTSSEVTVFMVDQYAYGSKGKGDWMLADSCGLTDWTTGQGRGLDCDSDRRFQAKYCVGVGNSSTASANDATASKYRSLLFNYISNDNDVNYHNMAEATGKIAHTDLHLETVVITDGQQSFEQYSATERTMNVVTKEALSNSAMSYDCFCIGGFLGRTGTPAKYSLTGKNTALRVGEALVFLCPLTDAEKMLVKGYLLRKWFGTTDPPAGTTAVEAEPVRQT